MPLKVEPKTKHTPSAELAAMILIERKMVALTAEERKRIILWLHQRFAEPEVQIVEPITHV